jgi:Uma2 family endonuclease
VATVRDVRPGEYVPEADQRVVLHRVPWDHYEAHLAMRGDRPVPRISYLRGTLELMSPSREHERITSWLGRLIEVFAEERGIELSPYRSWTLEHPEEAGAEPDECYIVGDDQSKTRPDLVIEVTWTSGGLDKLAVYESLGISEVWFWIEGRIEIHLLRAGRYERSDTSSWLAGIDLVQLCALVEIPKLGDAKRAYRAALQR